MPSAPDASPGNGYRECPDRYSPKGGKSKGKCGKHKGKGKVNNLDQADYYNDYMWCGFINVLTISNTLFALSTEVEGAEVVIDTGATETAGGVQSEGALLECGLTHMVSLADRPWFKFGDGEWARAVSRVDVNTPALGWLSIYVLGGTAEGTPIFLGSKTIENIDGEISYPKKVMKFEVKQNKMSVTMKKASSGHRLIDLNKAATAEGHETALAVG